MRILNLGSLNYDKVYGVEHFVSEGETISGMTYAEFFGGKGLNQSLAIARAGAEVFHAGAIGTDGDALKACLQDSGVDVSYLQQIDTVSGHAVIQNANGKNCIIVCGGANQCISEAYISDVLSHFDAGDILLLQNEVSNVAYAMKVAKERGMKIVFNASPITKELQSYPLELVDYFMINEVEGKVLAGIEEDDYEQILQALTLKFPNAAIVLTLGEHGVRYQDKEEAAGHDIYRVKAVDTTAAGDTFCGYFLAGVVKGLSVSDTLEIASKASAIAVSKMGAATSIPVWEEVQAFCGKDKPEEIYGYGYQTGI